MKIEFNGKQVCVDGPQPAVKIISELDREAAKQAIAVRVDGKTRELNFVIDGDCRIETLTFGDDEGRRTYRHTASHILAQAVKRLFPDARLAIGPAIENGFYYDIDYPENFGETELADIEREMKKIISSAYPIEKFTLERPEAIALMRELGEEYKVELIEDLPEGESISFYRQGEFTDLCAGPHLTSTAKVKAVKLLSCTGAYWKGESKNKMLKRIYGTAFPSNEMLTEYLAALEAARARDHNKIGRELEYFTTSDLIGQGLPIMLPKGAKTIQVLQRFVEDEEARRGYLLTKTPFMAKRELYKLSGHWDHYREGMFVLGDPDDEQAEVLALRPMTCPFQYQVFLNRMRSYRDLPMRLGETSTLFRNEESGEMHGLIRVRQFTISEGHIICTPEQLEDEFRGCVELAVFMMKAMGFSGDVTYRFSQWDPEDTEKFIGTPEQWNEAQGIMEKILGHLGIDYTVGVGEAAFYGPKLDIQMKNVHGKEDTLITVQIDQMLAEKFGMEYVDRDGEKKHPYIIHRTSLGCYERTLALLIEKYAGALPLWMAPTQVRILPISSDQCDYAREIKAALDQRKIRTEIDFRNEKIGYKIREARLEKIPVMLVIGEKEQNSQQVAVRIRGSEESSTMSLGECAAMIEEKINNLDVN